MKAIAERCNNCTACGLCKTRHSVVAGVGNPASPLMLIGEAPGQQEDLTGEPFVGAAGKLLDDMLSIIDIDRTNCFITNVIKCRPPHNRDPLPDEVSACSVFLRDQIAEINPKIIVCLGRIAAGYLIHDHYRITEEHGSWTCKDGIWYTAIYHPSALLRDIQKRPEAFRDLITIRNRIRELIPEFY